MTNIKIKKENDDCKSLSCIIPVHNRKDSVGAAIESILKQEYPIKEIIIVDDGSTDGLEGALKTFKEKVRLIRHEKNQGASAARNTGIKAASTEYIAFLDSDDIWLPGKLSDQMTFMFEGQLDLSCTNFEMHGLLEGHAVTAYRPYNEIMDKENFVWGCFTSPGSTLITRRSILLEAGGYDTTFPRYEDWDLLLRLSLNENIKIGFLNQSLAAIYIVKTKAVNDVYEGLRMMYKNHHQTLALNHKALSKKFLAALAFGKASHASLSGKRIKMLVNLMKSMFYCPINNQAIKLVLLPNILIGCRNIYLKIKKKSFNST